MHRLRKYFMGQISIVKVPEWGPSLPGVVTEVTF